MEKVIKYKGFSLKLTITDLSKTEEPETGYYGEVKGLDGCYTDGETLEELDAHIHEVLGMYELEEIEEAFNTQRKEREEQ